MQPIDLYKHRCVVPDLPHPDDYVWRLREMHERQWYSNFGPLVQALEQRLLEIFGGAGETCVTACNATAGLSAALIAAGRHGPVLIPAFTFPATLGAVHAAGMTPIVMDVRPDDWLIDPEVLDRALAETGATIVMPVAPFGLRCDFTAVTEVCRRRGVAVVFDNAAGLGAPRSAVARSEDVFEVFSMHATKPFGVGEGGVVFAHQKHEAALRSAISFALTSSGQSGGPRWGFNGKMSELHAAIGLAQTERYTGFVRERQRFVARYIERLREMDRLVFPNAAEAAPWQFFPVLLPSTQAADQFVAHAASVGVEIRRYYRPSLSRWPEVEVWGRCETAEDLAERMCVLPVRSLADSLEAGALQHLVVDALQKTLS